MKNPPVIARFLLRLFLHGEAHEVIAGDLMQEWQCMLGMGVSQRRAKRWYWGQAFGSVWAQRPHVRSRGSSGASRAFGTSLAQDLKFGIRSLRAQPMVSLMSICTLGVGLGAAAAVSAIGTSILAPPIPGAHSPEDLLDIRSLTRRPDGNRWSPTWLTPDQFEIPFGAVPSVDRIAGIAVAEANVALDGRAPERLTTNYSSWAYFEVLGVVPQRGRLWIPADDQPGAAIAVVISDQLWKRWYQRAESVVGSSISINGLAATVVGVTPPGFRGTPTYGGDVDVWLTGTSGQIVRHFPPDATGRSSRGRYYMFVGRAAPGSSAEVAARQLTTQLETIVQRFPDERERLSGTTVEAGRRLNVFPDARPRVKETLGLLYVIAIAVLLTGTANVANLLLFRGLRKRREIALRRALGASRARVARAQLVESGLLAVTGGGLGCLLALILTRFVEGIAFGAAVTVPRPGIDWRTFVIVILAVGFTTILAGTASAVMTARVGSLPPSEIVSRGSTRGRSVLRYGFSAVQIAISTLLLVGALLYAQTLRNLRNVDLNFRPEQVTTLGVNPGVQGYSTEQMLAYYRRLSESLSGVAGVQSASLSSVIPLNMYMLARAFSPEGTENDGAPVFLNYVTDSFFDTFGIPLLGRTFTPGEVWGDVVDVPVIVSQSVAVQILNDSLPIGRQVMVKWGSAKAWTIVGVVPDVRTQTPRSPAQPAVYFPFAHMADAIDRVHVAVRSPMLLGDVFRSIEAVASRVDPTLPLYDAESMSELIRRRLSEDRLFAMSLSGLSVLAVLLCAVGVYGVSAFGATERAREFVIRQAVGASPGRIFRLVLREMGLLSIGAVSIGLMAAAGFSRFVESRLFGVDPLHPGLYVLSGGVLVGVALVASLQPARRSTRVNPAAMLRHE